jgi:hypothetical protein
MQHLKAYWEAAKQGGLFFFLMLWMAWVFVSRQKWLM